jgi:glutamine synthetase
MVPLDHLYSCSRGSELFTGAAVDGVPQAVSDDEVCAVADPTTMAVPLPYRRDVCYMPASLYYHGEPFEPCSRNIYSRVAAKAKEQGYLFKLGIEAEFFVLRDSEDVAVMHQQQPYSFLENLHTSCYDASRLVDNLPWLSELVDAMDELGWGVYSFDHEDATGQFEVDFDFGEAGEMSDRFVLLRMMACQIARKHGCYATWMPKPMKGRTGSGAHLNVSLHDWETEKNLFKRSDGGEGLSELGTHFLGGVMKHLDAIVSVACPNVNSYKRMIWSPAQGSSSAAANVGFSWAPVFASHGANNRTNAIRVPASGRFEIRASDSAVNPHLASALVLAAGLEGIATKADPGPSRGHENLYASGAGEAGAGLLPRNLGEAVDAFEADPLAKEVFGESMHRAWVDYKKAEWGEYCAHVSEWEVHRYLRQFG